MRWRTGWMLGLLGVLACGGGALGNEAAPDPEAVERGRKILATAGHLPPAWSAMKPAWKADAYAKAGSLWGPDAPDPEADPDTYARAFNLRYGLHPAPFANDGLPMGLRLTRSADGTPNGGLTMDCLVCHGGSIGGTSYVGLGNTQLDMLALGQDLTRADGRIPLPAPFVVNTSRGTVNAGQMAVVLLSMRNTDLSFRRFPLLLGADMPETDTPAWWLLKKKRTKYADGRTPADDHRSNMQFLLGELTREQFEETEPAFADIQAFLESLEAPKYPFPIDRARADRGRVVFSKTCSRCHGTYGPEGTYPNKIVPLDIIGTDPARALGVSDRSVDHYNATWFGERNRVDEVMTGYQAPPLDGVWATAPYLHNGSVPTLAHLLDSSTRPARYRRPPSTDFAHYDTRRVGWSAEALPAPASPLPAAEERAYFDASRPGLGNGGHTFGDTLSEEQRRDLIEYLKSL